MAAGVFTGDGTGINESGYQGITYNGSGEYDPFSGGSNQGQGTFTFGIFGSSGGGNGYVPPVAPNPTFIPPSYSNEKIIKLTFTSQEPCEFLENVRSLGISQNVTVTHTNINFGSSKKYTAVCSNQTIVNYYTVSIEKQYRNSNSISNNSGFTEISDVGPNNPITRNSPDIATNIGTTNTGVVNLQFGQQSTNINDNLYTEILSIKEYQLDDTGNFAFLAEKKLDLSNAYQTLNFRFQQKIVKAPTNTTPTNPVVVNYDILFNSDFRNEIEQFLTLKYEITDPVNYNIIDSGLVKLVDGNIDSKQIEKSILTNSTINLKVEGTLPKGYTFKNFYYTTSTINDNIPFNKVTSPNWVKASQNFSVSGKDLLGRLKVYITIDKQVIKIKPTIRLSETLYNVDVKDSDKDKFVDIPFTVTNADYVDFHFRTSDVVRVSAADGFARLNFKKDFKGKYGPNNLRVVAVSDAYGTSGEGQPIIVNFLAIDNFPSITQITAPSEVTIPSFSDGNVEFEVNYKSINTTSVDVHLVMKDGSSEPIFQNLSPNTGFKISLKDLPIKYPKWVGSESVALKFKPVNRGGENELIGNTYDSVTKINYPSIKLDESIITKTIYDAFTEFLKFEEPEKDSKYLTHLANFGNDDRILISTYEEDNWTLSEKTEDDLGNQVIKNEVKSVIIKLYDPLPANITPNSTFWITKLMTNPLVETVILNEQAEEEYPYIKGPNFNIEVDYVKGNSTDYESLDDLIISASSSTNLIKTYLSASTILPEDLNIQYVSGTVDTEYEYLWDNFVHFSSAEERINNFVYKVQLIENYETLVTSASLSPTSGALATIQDIKRNTDKKNELIKGFDGFETFLYTSSSLYTSHTSESITWPYSGSNRVASSDQNVAKWYETISGLATYYDNNNPNYIINNIPQYILTTPENDNFLLFFSMVGHHFDSIYYYTKAIERNRQLGYKSKGTVTDKLLFDMLKSLSWEARNIGDSEALWKYVFGEDNAGNIKESDPIKNRRNEIWRRIVNNIPYLLKHKGTRRGIHALMACYGIPSSNLTIMEFGGPEVTNDSKSKLLIDDISYALKLVSGESFTIGNLSSTKCIEIFAKPAYSENWTLLTTNGNDIIVSGSVGSKYGKVKFGAIETPLLPIFNGKFFGIAVNNWGTYRELNVIQTDSDRLIFSASVTGSDTITTSGITIGSSFSGSIDEFRIWNQPLSYSVFQEHCFYPEMINGNHVSASTTDLDFRLDFEYPINFSTTLTDKMPNIVPGIVYTGTGSRKDYENDAELITGRTRIRSTIPFSSSGRNITPITTYPYNFEVIDRNCVLEIPDLGFSRYSTNKVRFESQSLVSDLSSKYRSTIKSNDNIPADSNRVGVFVSPQKELNLDIAKSIGAENLDDYIGDPSDKYNSNYKALDRLRNYYFKRITKRNIYEYIDLIKNYEKAMFEDIKQMLPARANVTTGLLIEPHFLERSKHPLRRPTAENELLEAETEYTSEINSEYTQYDSVVDANLSENLLGENNQYESTIINEIQYQAENNQYDSTIFANDEIQVNSEYESYETKIDARIELPTITSQEKNRETNILLGSLGANKYVEDGFGLYAQNGHALRNYLDFDGILRKDRVLVNLVTEQKSRKIQKYAIKVGTKGDPRGGFIPTTQSYTETKIVVQPYTGSNGTQSNPPTVTGNIISVVPVNGYLPSHYKFVGDLTTGLKNSYYNGSKNTAATTIDGTSPVESFISNPNSITVLPGRSASEPILETDT